jgi:DNA-directed RNA polymerase II subunit RPB2
MLQNYDKYIFKLFKNKSKYIKSFASPYIKSYNNFLNFDIENIIRENDTIIITPQIKQNQTKYIKLELKFTDVNIRKPEILLNSKKEKLLPNMCRIFNITYNVGIYVGYNLKIFLVNEENKTEKLQNEINNNSVLLCKFPCLVKSEYCNLYRLSEKELSKRREDRYEYGTYFILNGNERKIILHETKTQNMIYRNIIDKKYVIWIQSKKNNSFKYPYFTTVTLDENDLIYVCVYISKYQKKNTYCIPLLYFYAAFGIISQKKIYQMITGEDDSFDAILKKNFTHIIKSQEEGLEYLKNKYRKSPYHRDLRSTIKGGDERFIKIFMDVEFLPHIESRKKKMIFLSYMIKNVILLKQDRINVMDRNDYGNKRIKMAGAFSSQLFKHKLKLTIDEMRLNIMKVIKNKIKINQPETLIDKHLDSEKFSKSIEKHMSVGDWPVGGSTNNTHAVLSGVTSNFERRSPLASVMECQRISSIIKSKGGKNETISTTRRMLHGTQIGMLDAHDTPENEKVGIVKYKTYMSIITLSIDSNHIYKEIKKLDYVYDLNDNITHLLYSGNYSTKIFINGDYNFCSENSNIKKIYNHLIKLRRMSIINIYTSIIVEYELSEIRIFTDAGRMMLPLYIVKNKKLLITKIILEKIKKGLINWKQLITLGYIEYVSIHQLKYSCLVAINSEHLKNGFNFTHCLMSEKQLLSLNTLSIPLPEYIQAPRVTYLNSMSKQAGSKCYVDNYEHRLDTRNMILPKAQRSLCYTLGEELTNNIKQSSKQNLIVAITSYGGNNIEDAIQIDESSFNRGAGSIIAIKTYLMKKESDTEEFIKPNKNKTKNYKIFNSYNSLNENGLPKIGYRIKHGDIIIGKVKHLTKTEIEKMSNSHKMIDKSKIYDGLDDGYIDKVVKFKDNDGRDIVKVKVIFYRKATYGDKFTSFSAQKSVVGEKIKPEDCPFTEDGLRPDVIFNICALPKRMTMSQLMQACGGLIAIKEMKFFDMTCFSGIKIKEDLIDKLKKLGMKNAGDRILYDGKTGHKINSKIFMGPIPYARLKHMVYDKEYVRSFGSVDIETRQPGKGRSKGGGLRIGEMERDAFIANGVPGILHHKYVDHSNDFSRFISEESNFPCIGNNKQIIYKDNETNQKIARVTLPWISNYTYHLITTLNISMRFKLNDGIHEELKNKVSNPILTKFEIASIISFRVSQLQNGFKPKIKFKKYDPWLIALEELKKGLLNYYIERKMPDNKVEIWKLKDLEYIKY